jgi:hypothetical protein
VDHAATVVICGLVASIGAGMSSAIPSPNGGVWTDSTIRGVDALAEGIRAPDITRRLAGPAHTAAREAARALITKVIPPRPPTRKTHPASNCSATSPTSSRRPASPAQPRRKPRQQPRFSI